MKKEILIAVVLVATYSYCSAQDDFTISRACSSSKKLNEVKSDLFRWWQNFEDCSNKRLKDSVDAVDNLQLHFTGQFPVQYRMYGSTADGGVVRFDLKFSVQKGICNFTLNNFSHFATPGVKHKDGGPMASEKPMKGSNIFGKTWTGYQDQTRSFISTTVESLSNVLR
jgi:hypothetical protein